jgi:hypothetical protein
MDERVVQKWLDRYPDLEKFMDAGTISLKMAREILDVDRYFMYDMFKELLVAGAVTSSGTNSWRATKELKEFLKKKREARRNENA